MSRYRISALAANYAAEAYTFLGNFTEASRLLERYRSSSVPPTNSSLDQQKEQSLQQQQHQQQQHQGVSKAGGAGDTEVHRVTCANSLVVKLLNGKLGDTEKVAFAMNEVSGYPETSHTLLYANYRLGHIPEGRPRNS
jgi:hypothetical protein